MFMQNVFHVNEISAVIFKPANGDKLVNHVILYIHDQYLKKEKIENTQVYE